jgi:hypothetical protein
MRNKQSLFGFVNIVPVCPECSLMLTEGATLRLLFIASYQISPHPSYLESPPNRRHGSPIKSETRIGDQKEKSSIIQHLGPVLHINIE